MTGDPESSLREAVRGFTSSQREHAFALIAAGRVTPVAGLSCYVSLSSDGVTRYVTDVNGCNCPATVPCYHQCAVRLLTAWRENSRQPVLTLVRS